MGSSPIRVATRYASVAQLVEQRTENPRVVGSIPTGGTICGFSSFGRARPCQGRGGGFEPRNPLQKTSETQQGVACFFVFKRITGENPLRATSKSIPKEERKWSEGSFFRFAEQMIAIASKEKLLACANENAKRTPLSPVTMPLWHRYFFAFERITGENPLRATSKSIPKEERKRSEGSFFRFAKQMIAIASKEKLLACANENAKRTPLSPVTMPFFVMSIYQLC